MISIGRDYYFDFKYRYQLYLYFIAVGDKIQEIFEIFLKKLKRNSYGVCRTFKRITKTSSPNSGELAKRLGIGQSSYADWERGKKKPTQENLVKISQVLNVSIDYLVGNSEEKSDELDNIELLFRMNSKGLTDEEKEIFKKELIEFMEERKKAFNKGN